MVGSAADDCSGGPGKLEPDKAGEGRAIRRVAPDPRGRIQFAAERVEVHTRRRRDPATIRPQVNTAFGALPAGTVDTLLKPESKPALSKVLTYHVVAGKMDSAALVKTIDAGGGKAMLTAVSGGMLTATKSGSTVMVADESGGTAKVTIADVVQSNGVIHVVDKVLLPK